MAKSATEKTSGKISIDNDKVTWYKDKLVLTEFYLSDIVLLGEFTNSDGPWLDDWYMIFVSKDQKWYSISQYADNIEELIKVLCLRFDPVLKGRQLFFSTSWRSIVSYPKKLRGKELFTLVPSETYKEPRTFMDKILHSIGLGKFDTSKELKLTDEVVNEIDGSR